MSQSAPKYFETDGTATANWYRLANGTRKYAKNLHEALASAIELHCGGKWGRSEVEAAGRRDYEAAFGHPISSRHLWRLIEMIIDRTGDRRQFDDLSLYLPPRLVRKPSKAVFDRLADELPALASHVLLVNDPKAPTANERLLLWDSACRECQRLIDAGVSKRKAVRAVVVALDASGIALAS